VPVYKATNVKKKINNNLKRDSGFTLIELVVVTVIIAIMGTLIAVRAGVFVFWREEGFLRRLTETITFLHYQATVDRLYYQINFNPKVRNYTVVALKPIKDTSATITSGGKLTQELAELQSPALGVSYNASPPPDFPSLAEPVLFPEGLKLIALHLPNLSLNTEDLKDTDVVSIIFSPQGIVDGSIIEFVNAQGAPINLVVNPFTGLSKIYRKEVDFAKLIEFSADENINSE